MNGKYGDIDADNNSLQSYYIIIFNSYQYTLQEDFNIDGKVMSSVETVCRENYYIPISINSHYYVS